MVAQAKANKNQNPAPERTRGFFFGLKVTIGYGRALGPKVRWMPL